MNKILLRYLIYFGIFICFVQIMESAPLQGAFAKVGLKMNFESLGTYAPLFLSALLIDITYRIGKRQNEIAERQNELAKMQNEIAEQQRILQEQQYKLDKYNTFKEMHRHLCDLRRIARIILNNVTHYIASQCKIEYKECLLELEKEVKIIRDNIHNDEADYFLRYGKERDMANAEGFTHLLVHLILEIEAFERKDLNGTKYVTEYGYGQMVGVINKTMEEQVDLIKLLANDKMLASLLDEFMLEFNTLFVNDNCVLKQIQREYAE